MNNFEKACREWMKGCSVSKPEDKPWECPECTENFYKHLHDLCRRRDNSIMDDETKLLLILCHALHTWELWLKDTGRARFLPVEDSEVIVRYTTEPVFKSLVDLIYNKIKEANL